MDLQERRMDPATATGSDAATWPAESARAVLPIYKVEDSIRRRRNQSLFARIFLILLDVAMINLAFVAAYFLRFIVFRGVDLSNGFRNEDYSSFYELQIIVTVGLLIAFSLRGLYRLRTASPWAKQFWIIASATTSAFAIFTALDYLLRSTDLAIDAQSRAVVIFTWAAVIALVSLARLLVVSALIFLYRRGFFLTKLLVVGSGRLGKLTMQQIAASPRLGYRVVGFVEEQHVPLTDFGRFKSLGYIWELDQVIRGARAAQVIVTLPSHDHQAILQTANICERAGADYKLVPDMYELSLSRINVDTIEGIPLIGLRRDTVNQFQMRVKRLFDIVIASAALLFGAPIWLLVALAIKLDSPGPILFSQQRIGLRGEPFGFLKFRSMRVDAEEVLDELRTTAAERNLFKQKNDPRRTRVGRFIRPFSIDEIPQLINVLRGEMSLIGPRPLPVVESRNYDDWEKGRFEMKPGLTGLWQVRGRSDIKFDEMILMDLYYIENWSLKLDLQIILQTIPAVLLRRGAY
jgi:exopolysaccharide biosynthesis polyprenyl glycosylphosphotransferase